MEDLERAIRNAWLSLRDKILSDPYELQKRLSRRRLKSLTRPPRAWCIALRASDTRINLTNAIITPSHALDLDHPLHPYQPIEHEVLLVPHTLRRLCRPVRIPSPGLTVNEVAKLLGVNPKALREARLRGLFSERSYSWLGGKPGVRVPVIYTREALDPSASNFHARPHPLWGSMWELLPDLLPNDFQQPLIRRPFFPTPTTSGTPARHPHAPHRKNSLARHPDDDPQFLGYRWLCPSCKKSVRTIYYPLPPRTLFDCDFTDPSIQLKLTDADLPNSPPPTFACSKCHRIRWFTGYDKNDWTYLIFQLTAGLLFGHEVQKPSWFIPQRKNTRSRHLHRPAPRRQMVLRRLLNGWSKNRIAKDLQVAPGCIHIHITHLCAQENVKNRHELAAKLRASTPPPLNQIELARLRRAKVRNLLLEGLSRPQIKKQLDLDVSTLSRDINAIYKLHNIKGHGHNARRALAQKFSVPYTSAADHFREKISTLRSQKLTWPQISKHLHKSIPTLAYHSKKLKQQLNQNAQRACPIEVLPP
jgi:DNA-binding NarL/FixJ family response regulator